MQTPGQMHPQDTRNMIIFMIVAVLLWFGFDHFVLKPRIAENVRIAQTQAQAVTAGAVATAEKPRPREQVLADTKRLTIESPEMTGTIPLTGNRLDDVSLKNYFEHEDLKDPVVLLMPSGSPHPHYAEFGWLGDNVVVPGKDTTWTVKDGAEKLTPGTPVTMTWDNGHGLVFERTLALDENFMMTVTQTVTNNGKTTVTLYPYAALAHRGIPQRYKGDAMVHEGATAYIGDELIETNYADLADEPAQTLSANNGWIGFGQKYWLTALIPSQKETHDFTIRTTAPKLAGEEPLFQTDVRGQAHAIGPGEEITETTNFYIGAKKIKLLESYESKLGLTHFDLAVDFGMLYFMTRPLYFLLTLFNDWTGNFGIAIILLTLMVRAAVFPLANTSYRSFAMLKKVSPRMAELREKYGNDKPRLQQELVKLYETEKVNPMAGCLPILIQIPIFFAVYRVITIAIEMRHAPFFGWITDLSARDPLSVFNLFGLLPYSVPAILMIGPWSVAMFILMWIQRNMNPPATDPTQRMMINFMPFFITYILSSFPSGLVIYWTFSNLISVIQQYAMMRSLGVPVYLFSPEAAKEHEAQHTQKVADALQRAKAEADAEKVKVKKKNEAVEEALFDERKDP